MSDERMSILKKMTIESLKDPNIDDDKKALFEMVLKDLHAGSAAENRLLFLEDINSDLNEAK